MRPRKILVPLDGRRASETALAAAGDFAKDSGARLYLLRVLDRPAPTVSASVRQRAAVERAERYLAETREQLAAAGIRDVSTAVWSGAPAAAIVKAADLTGADMIVMASGGPTGAPRTLVGSVAERVLRGTKRPVLVVTPADAVVDTSLGDAAPLDSGPAPERHAPVAADARVERDPPPAEAYRTALQSLQHCEREVLRLVMTIQGAAKHLEHWQAVHVAHAGVGFPKEVTTTGRAIDATAWPTGGQLAETLAAWHAAAEAARDAWSHVPPAERATLPPPP